MGLHILLRPHVVVLLTFSSLLEPMAQKTHSLVSHVAGPCLTTLSSELCSTFLPVGFFHEPEVLPSVSALPMNCKGPGDGFRVGKAKKGRDRALSPDAGSIERPDHSLPAPVPEQDALP